MSQDLEELPLFLLNTVLFPYAHIRLHVFEERYKELVRECVENDRPFGIVLIRTGQEVGGTADPYMVGTVVHIERVEHLKDGRLEIHIHGDRRFRIRRLDESKPYLTGYVEPVVEHAIEDETAAAAVLSTAQAEFEILFQKLFPKNNYDVQVKFPNDPIVLSFTIANLLSMETLEKQRLLETTDTVERVQALIPILRTQNFEGGHKAYYQISSADLADWITLN